MTWQWAVFLVLGVALLVLEVIGVASPRNDDTITEGFRAILARVPKPVAMILLFCTLGLLLWTAIHFAQGYI